METLSNYHVGETVLSLQKATLIPGGSESLVYTTLSGGVGMLVPFTSREVRYICICLASKFHSEGTRYLLTTGEMLRRLEKTLFCF